MDEHRTLDAVKLYCEQTGAKLPDGKKAVEAIAGVQEIDADLQTALLELLNRDEKIQAVKLYKDRTGESGRGQEVVEGFARGTACRIAAQDAPAGAGSGIGDGLRCRGDCGVPGRDGGPCRRSAPLIITKTPCSTRRRPTGGS